jgi:hypothetical protein
VKPELTGLNCVNGHSERATDEFGTGRGSFEPRSSASSDGMLRFLQNAFDHPFHQSGVGRVVVVLRAVAIKGFIVEAQEVRLFR